MSERKHDLTVSVIKELATPSASPLDKEIYSVAKGICCAKKKSRSTIMLMGGHVIRSGVQKYIIDLMERGYISCLAMNGAGIIHDFELALIGATTESVARYIKDGQFGLWKETARLNDIINESYRKDKSVGMGESVGRAISLGDFPCKEISLLAAGHRLSIPITVHVGIGYDIIHEYPNCDGAATGATSFNDFLTFAHSVQNLENGVVMNFGSAVMAPEVFLKALSMARNIAHQEKRDIKHFTTLVCDLLELPGGFHKEPVRDNPAYYFRPWKTMLVRTVADGGQSYYIKGKHSETIPALWNAINGEESSEELSGSRERCFSEGS
ncbi:MAG: hypothetical protein SCALA701_04600 [Candidatus Scalindua sp.]|nr:MAG: hypothetical protein SCALA701_04600 [Candidatus Scalindua sp.]